MPLRAYPINPLSRNPRGLAPGLLTPLGKTAMAEPEDTSTPHPAPFTNMAPGQLSASLMDLAQQLSTLASSGQAQLNNLAEQLTRMASATCPHADATDTPKTPDPSAPETDPDGINLDDLFDEGDDPLG